MVNKYIMLKFFLLHWSKSNRGSEIFLILKTNFIWNYNTGFKLQKKHKSQKKNMGIMQRKIEGIKEARKRAGERERQRKERFQDRQNDLIFPKSQLLFSVYILVNYRYYR